MPKRKETNKVKAKLTQTVWKVVTKGSDGKLRSATTRIDGLTLIYSKKRFVKPKLKSSQMFCFKTKSGAQAFAGESSNKEIWRAEAKNAKELMTFVSGGLVSLEEAERAWTYGGRHYGFSCPFADSLGCDALKLVSKCRIKQ